jgi:chromosome segregation ATPase
MAGKKSKALEHNLIDELLNEEDFSINMDKTQEQAVEVDPNADDSAAQNFDFSISQINDPNKTEVSGPNVDDKTQRLSESRVNESAPAEEQPRDKVRASVGRFGAFRSTGPANSTEAALAQSESLRIAQNRLLEFEQEIERLRQQNEELAAAGETLRRRTDELLAQNNKRESDYQNAVSTFEQEKQILTGSKDALQRDLELARRKAEELELRISTNIQKIRVRERELENRLELMKMESAALLRSKDETILELKRNIDQLNLELNNYRAKNQELNRQTTDKQEMLRRTVKALRLALSMLEGEEEVRPAAAQGPQRKAK